MKEILDFIAKNKYIIICVAVVVILYALGIVGFLAKALLLIALVLLAIFVGKKLQENDNYLKEFFDFKKWKKEDSSVYYYQDRKEDKSNKKE